MRQHLASLFLGLLIIAGLGLTTVLYQTAATEPEETGREPITSPVWDRAVQPLLLPAGTTTLKVALAATTAAREQGLSGRPILADDEGLLFVFATSDHHGFWMREMNFPIDIIWLTDDFTVADIMANVATSTYPEIFYPPQPVRYVLEVNAGLAARAGWSTGVRLNFYRSL